jgi:plasmid stabilization system protein ParE
MKRWKVTYGDGAKDDILAITDFISHDSTINADKVLDQLEDRIRTLDRLPERGRIVPELQWHGINTIREIFEKPWRILYQITDVNVLVVAVYDGRRQLNDVLMERFLRH